MKMIKTFLASLLCSIGLLAAPGEVHKGTLTLVWDPPSAEDSVRGYRLWVTTNLPPGMALPIPDEQTLIEMALPTDGASLFEPYLEIAGDATSVSLTNIWSQLGTWAFFVLTATNEVSESPFSNPAVLVAPLGERGGLTVRLEQ